MNHNDVILKNNRGYNLHTTIIEPTNNMPKKLVLMAHGFRADRSEGGRFIELAHKLALNGYYSVCLSFSGCGDSEEPFDNYCFKNCLDDLETVHKYMLKTYDLKDADISVVGYSMGGSIAIEYSKRHPEIKNIILWAAVTLNGPLPFLLNGIKIEDMLKEAEANKYCLVKNQFGGEDLHYSYDFIKEMNESKVRDIISEYKGNVLLIHGDADDIVPIDISRKTFDNLKSAKEKKLVTVPFANHGFGLWDDHPKQSETLIYESYKFLLDNCL